VNKEIIYNYSPYWLRNLWISLFGYKLAKERYGKSYLEHFDLYKKIQFDSVEQIHERQNGMFREFVSFAASNSPFYREFYKDCNLPGNISEISNLPILTKELLRKNDEKLRTGELGSDKICIHTSGTTGTPLTYYFAKEDFQARIALLDSYKEWFGVKRGDKRASFTGRIIKPANSRSKKFWQMNFMINQRLYSTYHLSKDNLKYYIEDLEKYQPVFMDGYPSAFLVLAKYFLAGNTKPGFRPKVIFTTAETIKPYEKELIEKAFGCPLSDHHGSSEGAPVTAQCEYGKYHFLSFLGVMEVLDENNRPANAGRAVLTCFNTRFMPLIRYDIGDYVKLSDEKSCSCGRNYPIVESVLGREEDYIVTTERGKVGRLDPIFKNSPSTIIKTQIVQNEIDKVDVLYVPDELKFKSEHLDVIKDQLLARIGSNTEVRFNKVMDIPVGKNGKFKAVISNVGK